MKHEIKAAVIGVLKTDPSVESETISAAMEILEGQRRPSEPRPLSRIVHRKEARMILGVCDRTLDYLVKHGKLARVFGCGRRAIGFTEESIRALAEARTTAKEVA